MLITTLAGLGATAVIVGARLPWISVFGGIRSYRGTIGRNGQLLLAGGIATWATAIVYGIRGARALRALLGVLGLALALFSAYLIAQLLATYRSLEGMFLPGLGPGVFVAAGGAAAVMSSLLINSPTEPRVRTTARMGPGTAALVALATGAGAIHLAVAADHLREYVPYGVFFLCLGTAQVAWAMWISLRSPSRRVLVGAAAASAGVVVLWALSRTVGLPLGPAPGVAEAVGLPDLGATAFEVLLVAVTMSMLGGGRHRSPRTARGLRRRLPKALGWTLPAAVAPATILSVWLAASSPGH